MKIISNVNRIVTRSMVAFFVVVGLSVGMAIPVSAGTDNGTSNWYKHTDFTPANTPG